METPHCLRCRHLLSAAMDGEATFNEAEFVRQHLMGCPDCREAQQAYNSLRVQLRLLTTPEPPAALRMAVMNRVYGNKAVYKGRKPAAGLYFFLAPWQKAAFATAALVLVFVAGFVASMILRGQPFEVQGTPVANTTEQKVVIAFNRPVDRNYIIENAPTLFSVKDAQNNPLEIDFANIVVDGNTVELPIKRDGTQLQENEKIQVLVDSHIKDEKGAEVTNPGSKTAVAVTQAPAVATKTKPGQVQAAVTTAVPPTATTAPATTTSTTAPVPQVVTDPTLTAAPPTATVSPTVVITPTVTSHPVTPTVTVPVTITITAPVSPPTVTISPTVVVTPTVPITDTVQATATVPPTTTPRPTSTATATVLSTVPATPGTPTVPVTTGPPDTTTTTPVISVTTPAGPSTTPGTLTPSTVSGSPSVSVSPSAACSSTEMTGEFKKLYPNAVARLGCATAPQSQASFTYQAFQKGSMLYYQQTGRIYVFYSFGGWTNYRATGPVAQAVTNTPASTAGSVTPNPSGCSLVPRGSFGTLWSNNQAVQSALGCPSDSDASTSAAIAQNFSRGLMLYNPLANLPYSVVYADGGFQAFPNQ